MDADFGLAEPPEIIFCRNVIIYFDRPTQVRLLEKLTRQLAPGGYFFAGHSESLQGMDLPLVPAGAGRLQETPMTEPALILPDLNLQPGELYLARSPAILRTILGSCVGVTFWSARLGAGALCHGVLPRCPQSGPQAPASPKGTAMWTSVFATWPQQFDALGARRRELEVKAIRRRRRASRRRGPPDDKPTVGALNCRSRGRGSGGGGIHGVRIRPGRSARPHESTFTPGRAKCWCTGWPAQPAVKDGFMPWKSEDCAMNKRKNSRPDRGRFRAWSARP